MAKAKVRTEFNSLLGAFRKKLFINRRFQKDLGETIVEAIKDATDSGLSPVKGRGRFVAYSVQRNEANTQAEKKKLYPRNVLNKYPSKRDRPVNLRLSGELMKSLSFRATTKGVSVGHFNPNADIKEKFEAHNEGSKPNVPQRKYLPTKGDTFNATIMRKIKEAVLSNLSIFKKRR